MWALNNNLAAVDLPLPDVPNIIILALVLLFATGTINFKTTASNNEQIADDKGSNESEQNNSNNNESLYSFSTLSKFSLLLSKSSVYIAL